jgi:hypothetical protein
MFFVQNIKNILIDNSSIMQGILKLCSLKSSPENITSLTFLFRAEAILSPLRSVNFNQCSISWLHWKTMWLCCSLQHKLLKSMEHFSLCPGDGASTSTKDNSTIIIHVCKYFGCIRLLVQNHFNAVLDWSSVNEQFLPFQ